jgi:hypothetical protein
VSDAYEHYDCCDFSPVPLRPISLSFIKNPSRIRIPAHDLYSHILPTPSCIASHRIFPSRLLHLPTFPRLSYLPAPLCILILASVAFVMWD